MSSSVPASSPTPIPADQIDKTFAKTTNLASSGLNSKVLSCSDEYFAEAANLLTPTPAVHKPGVFVHTGAWYDGWETRRHNPAEFDWAVIELGAGSGVIEGVEIDTACFVGNYGEKALVEGTFIADKSSKEAEDVKKPEYAGWTTILPAQPCGPSRRQAWALGSPTGPVTHVRVRMYPDGGFARLRLYGHALPPTLVNVAATAESVPVEELSSALMGGLLVSASNQHFTPASNMLLPGRGKHMGDGWETARSRTPGHVDWAIVKLGLPGSVSKVVVDTKDFRGNFPRTIRVDGIDWKGADDPSHDHSDWAELVKGEPACKADLEHVYEGDGLVGGTGEKKFTHVKLSIIPDGGVKRFRVFGKRDIK